MGGGEWLGRASGAGCRGEDAAFVSRDSMNVTGRLNQIGGLDASLWCPIQGWSPRLFTLNVGLVRGNSGCKVGCKGRTSGKIKGYL